MCSQSDGDLIYSYYSECRASKCTLTAKKKFIQNVMPTMVSAVRGFFLHVVHNNMLQFRLFG
jgi:hypothetical protein